MSASFWVTLAGAALGAGAAHGVKELLAHYFGKSNQVEHDRDADLLELRETALSIRDMATDYWKFKDTDGCTNADAAILVGRMSMLGSVVARLFEAKVESKRKIDIKLNRFDKSVTNGQFQVKNREPDLSRVTEIEEACYALINCATTHRRRLEHKPMKIRRR